MSSKATVCSLYNDLYVEKAGLSVPLMSEEAAPDQCATGALTEAHYTDAFNRISFARQLVGLSIPDKADEQLDKATQQCALMVGRSLNRDSKAFVDVQNAHSETDKFACNTQGAKDVARSGNIYAGQSIPDLAYNWRTTPSFIVHSLLVDTASSKVGHRQNILCPQNTMIGVGHVCWKGGSDEENRFFCGGCHSFESLSSALALDLPKMIMWPPSGAIPDAVFPRSITYWSLALPQVTTLTADASVTINGNAVRVQKVDTLCDGWSMFRFRPLDSDPTVYNVVVSVGGVTVSQHQTEFVECAPASPTSTSGPTNNNNNNNNNNIDMNLHVDCGRQLTSWLVLLIIVVIALV
eukprot:TRINITY_DN47_c0_g7_i2.p1 TRINITY_DN47_c0_g7~~TRINITY_DN47_c0_g7_i2.p1  ORF type:complete len:351 (-),score=23.59 TRINITY_DN47_c0_g7_i2:23-1075(-)